MIQEHESLIEDLKKNKKLSMYLIKIVKLLTNKNKIYKGPRGGLYYFTDNNTKIYITK
jgi:hypothetical protein